jgi:glucose/arabinose dehydrogenase
MRFLNSSTTASLTLAVSLASPNSSLAQNRIGTGKVVEIYQNYCSHCHGDRLEGGTGGSLIDLQTANTSDAEIARIIREGVLENGMPGWSSALTEDEIRSLVIYIREQRQLAQSGQIKIRTTPTNGVFTTERTKFRLETAAPPLDGIAWAIDFLPDGRALVTERSGNLWILEDGAWKGPVKGIPEVLARGQGGLLDVAVHPNFAENGWIYLSYSDASGDGAMTRFVRGKIDALQWTDEEVILEFDDALYIDSRHHYGSRFAFKDGYVFMGIGDRGRRPMAQDLSKPNGKIFRVHDDGRIPADNPFVETEGALPSIWSLGHRNPQGLDIDPTTGELWETEHGPRGGDEVNLIRPGVNYGWPEITYGMNYDGSPITDATEAPGLEQPAHIWTPSIAPCGIAFYTGDLIPEWKNDLFATGLSAQEIQRIRIRDGVVTETEIVLKDQGRARDLATGPDGALYVLLVEPGGGPSHLKRLVPATD